MQYFNRSGIPGRCFACINSGAGFISYFDRFFSETDYLYILKGGPGTGKSGVLRHLANAAEKRGEDVLRLYCSSDPDSLDGAVFPQRRIAVTDGTAPHIANENVPGVDSGIVDLGAFWNKELLRENKDEIVRLNAAKSAAFRRAYSLLAAAKNAADCADNVVRPLLKKAALTKRAAALLKGARAQRCAPDSAVFPVCSIGMKGSFRLDDLEAAAENRVFLKDRSGAAFFLLEALERAARERGVFFLVSPDPVTLRPDALFFPADRLLVGRARENGAKAAETRSFFELPDKETAASLRTYEKEARSLAALAEKELISAASDHFALERIYGRAMDFSRVEETKHTLEKEIFGA